MGNLNTPILYLVFNRIDCVKKTFPEIQKAKPKQLFIASDGARNLKEKIIVKNIREYILNNIDWECDVKTLFRDKNLGCKYAIFTAINWFFENVEQGIILEDDCLPDPSFFKFCQEMLEKYKNNNKIMSISGQNSLRELKHLKNSYTFSKNFFCWGWATWKDSWAKMDLEMDNYKNDKDLFSLNSEKYIIGKRFLDNKRCITNSWCISFSFSHRFNNKLCIIPKKNIVENIGLNIKLYTHTKPNYFDNRYSHHEAQEIEFPLKHPLIIKQDMDFEKKFLYLDIKRAVLKKIFIPFKRETLKA